MNLARPARVVPALAGTPNLEPAPAASEAGLAALAQAQAFRPPGRRPRDLACL